MSRSVQQWGSPHRHWKQIHWIRIPNLDSMWSHVSSTRHTYYAHCTTWLDLTHCHAAQHTAWIQIKAVWRKVVFEAGSPIRIGCESKVPCGEPCPNIETNKWPSKSISISFQWCLFVIILLQVSTRKSYKCMFRLFILKLEHFEQI